MEALRDLLRKLKIEYMVDSVGNRFTISCVLKCREAPNSKIVCIGILGNVAEFEYLEEDGKIRRHALPDSSEVINRYEEIVLEAEEDDEFRLDQESLSTSKWVLDVIHFLIEPRRKIRWKSI